MAVIGSDATADNDILKVAVAKKQAYSFTVAEPGSARRGGVWSLMTVLHVNGTQKGQNWQWHVPVFVYKR